MLSSWNATYMLTVKFSGIVTESETGEALPGVNVVLKGSSLSTLTDNNGYYEIEVPSGPGTLVFSYIGYTTREVKIKDQKIIDVKMDPDVQNLSEVVVTGYSTVERKQMTGAVAIFAPKESASYEIRAYESYYPPHNTEEYDVIDDNIFREAKANPLSTFSIDVDNASYSNMRRFINNGQMPP